MIRITIHSPTPQKTFIFEGPRVLIGSQGADMALSDTLEKEHLTILTEKNQFILINSANDPFVTLNGVPFGKKILKDRDLIQVGRFVLFFEGTLPTPPQVLSEASNVDLEMLFRKVEELENNQEEDRQEDRTVKPPAKETNVSVSSQTQLVFQSVIDAEDEIEVIQERAESEEPASKSKVSKLLAGGGAVITLLLLMILSMVYFKADDRSSREQMIAAEAVADVSMALAYTQINHITPQKQNWFDPEFLKNNLASVLSSDYPSFANIDNLGQFQNCPYILRIYTSIDLEQFLVIAQPAATISNWLFPRPAIAIDSKTMEMRKISNIKALNRLLANPNVLDSSQSTEISYLVRQGELIQLNTFFKGQGFAAPKALSLVRPGAENLIYNAPRYYQFTETFLNKSLSLLQIMGSSFEVTRLQQQMNELAKYPSLILYSSQGMHKAVQAQKALGMLVPSHPFMVAYLTLNHEGLITNSHLLLNEDYPDFLVNATSTTGKLQSLSTFPQATDATAEIADNSLTVKEKNPSEFQLGVDVHHPLYLKLAALNTERQKALKMVSERMVSLLNHHNEGKTVSFSENFPKLLTWYLQVDQQQHDKILEELKRLYQEYSAMPVAELIDYVKAAGLEMLARDSLANLSQEALTAGITPEQISSQFQKLQNVDSFKELDAVVNETVDLLNLQQIPDHKRLIQHQNELKMRTLQQLAKFMLSPHARLSPAEFSEENRVFLIQILKHAWVTENDEVEFYLHEFDLLTEENQKPV